MSPKILPFVCSPFTGRGYFASLHPELAMLFCWLFSGRDSCFSFIGGGAGLWLLHGRLKVFFILSNLKRKNSNSKIPQKKKKPKKTKQKKTNNKPINKNFKLQLLKSFHRRHSPKLVSLLPPCLFFPFSLHSFLWLEFYFLWLYILCKCNLSIYNCEVELLMCYIS